MAMGMAAMSRSATSITFLFPSSTSQSSSSKLLSLPRHRALDKLFATRYGGRSRKRPLSTSATYSQTRDFSAQIQDRIGKIPELVQDIVQTSIKTGPRGAIRLAQGIQATMVVGGEWLSEVSKSANTSMDALTGLQLGLLGPTYLRRLFERMGATYIKLGQFIASTPTLFPPDYVKEFQTCFDNVPAVPFHEIEAIIKKELRQPLGNVYEYIDPIPVASASIAQVHGARLRGSKQEVVIKVVKPGIEDILIADLNFLYIAARMLEFLNPQISRTSLVGIIGDIRESMLEEVDFQKEAANIESFRVYLETMGLTRQATAPKVYRHCSTQRVLTLERLYGVPLTDLDSIQSLVSNPELTLITALNVWFGSVLSCETFHADVHAGNLWLLRDGRVGFLDFGIVGRISPRTWTAMQTFLTSIATGEYGAMAVALVQMGATNNDIDTTSFARDLEKIFSSIQDMDSELIIAATREPNNATISANLAFDERQMNALFLDVVRVSESYGLKFPREFALLMKQFLYFDRYTRLIAPSLNMFEDDRIALRHEKTYNGNSVIIDGNIL